MLETGNITDDSSQALPFNYFLFTLTFYNIKNNHLYSAFPQKLKMKLELFEIQFEPQNNIHFPISFLKYETKTKLKVC